MNHRDSFGWFTFLVTQKKNSLKEITFRRYLDFLNLVQIPAETKKEKFVEFFFDEKLTARQHTA